MVGDGNGIPPGTQIHYVDLPEVRETFVDSIKLSTFNSGVLRVELCSSRLQDPPKDKNVTPIVKQYPVVRLVMTPDLAVDLFNQLNQFLGMMKQQGLINEVPNAHSAPVTNQPN